MHASQIELSGETPSGRQVLESDERTTSAISILKFFKPEMNEIFFVPTYFSENNGIEYIASLPRQ
jgi:hypothetical protein